MTTIALVVAFFSFVSMGNRGFRYVREDFSNIWQVAEFGPQFASSN